MSRKELRNYILQNRHDNEKVNVAIAESISRSDWIRVSADTPLEEQERILRKAIEGKK